MPLTNAEKQRRYKERLKQDPDKYNEYKKKKRENYHAKKRLTKDLNPKERYNARVIWRIRKKNQRERVRNLNRVLEETPPSSPGFPDADTDAEQDVADQNKNYDVHQEQNVCDSPTVGAAKKGRMKVRRDRSKIYRENVELKKENEKLKHKYEKYKKRLQRTKKKLEKKVKIPTEKEKYENLSNAIKDKYKKSKNRKDKNIVKSVQS